MALLVLLSVLSCSAVGTAIGGRLLGVARQTRQLPELLIGTGLFVYSSLALPALLIMGLPWLSVGAARVFQLVQQVANFVTLSAIIAFTWRVFRPGESWARVLVAAGIVFALVASWGSVSVAPEAQGASAMPAQVRPYVSLMVLVWAGTFLWTGLESLRYHAMMQRRLVLGLGDPVVCNRFLLWAVWGIGCCMLDLLTLGFNLAGLDLSRHPAPLLTICITCFLSSAVWYLAFLAPESYVHRIASRARS